jgi:hypothetical protein
MRLGLPGSPAHCSLISPPPTRVHSNRPQTPHQERGNLIALPYVLSCLCLAERLHAGPVEDMAFVLLCQILLSLEAVEHAHDLLQVLLPRMLGRGEGCSVRSGDGGWRATALGDAWLTLARCVEQRGPSSSALQHVERAERIYRQAGSVERLQVALSLKARLYHVTGAAVTLRNAAAREVRLLEEEAAAAIG